MLTYFEKNVSESHQYASDIVSGRIVSCLKIKQSCQRYLDDLESPSLGYYFDPSLAEKACRFIQLLPHTKGKWASAKELLVLQPWQKFIICNIFGWVNEQGLRRFNRAYIKIARKNGKSILGAAIALYCFCCDHEEGAEVFAGATTEKEALKVFAPARSMVLKTPALAQRFGITTLTESLIIEESNSKFECKVGEPADGDNPHCWIIDEYHEHPTSKQYDCAISGMGSREQPLLVVITTAGVDISSPCFDLEQTAKDVVGGKVKDENLFVICYEVDLEDDWKNFEACALKSNPNLGISISENFLRQQHSIALKNPGQQNRFRIKHFNQWVNSKNPWISELAWSKCADPLLKIEEFVGKDICIGAIDLSSKLDICACLWLFLREQNGKKHFYIFGDYYLPQETILLSSTHAYSGWVNAGYLHQIEGTEIDTEVIISRAKEIHRLCGSKLREITYDPWRAGDLIEALNADHIKTVEFRQVTSKISPAAREVEAAINSGRVHHDGNPCLAWQVLNAVVKEDIKGTIFPQKQKATNKIDAAMALVMAVGRAIAESENQQSIFNNPDRKIRYL